MNLQLRTRMDLKWKIGRRVLRYRSIDDRRRCFRRSERRLWRSECRLGHHVVGMTVLLFAITLSGSVRAQEPDAVEVGLPPEAPITADDREHWSLVPIARPDVPEVGNSGRTENAIDNFVMAELESEQLALAPPAGPKILIRRLKFDLLGLPPTVSETDAFLAANEYPSYERLVDRYLSAPAFGERWGQHWLDLARFAETDGFEHDKVRPGAWKYRDWIIQAINNDLPYDTFISSQLAADLLVPDEESARIATMFCMSGPDMPDINRQELRRHSKLNELTSTVGAAVLGYQFHCAECHDHKYDPISQADFYRLRAVFESGVGPMIRDKHVLMLEHQPDAEPPQFYRRGEFDKPAGPVPAGLPRFAVAEGESYLCDSAKPRLEFCQWLFERENPLTARVIVNRIWQHHFGVSLTENPSDFGVVAGGPSHPELLDWLACELIESGWSMKHLHRLIVTSCTYRQSGLSAERAPLVNQSDPGNSLYSYFPRRRLEGEAIRDAMLFVSRRLNSQMGGASVLPPLPPEMKSTLLKGQWKTSASIADHCRRSIYTFARRNLRYPIFDVFDRPDAGQTCAARDRSTTALQSLQMLNSNFTLECARSLANHLVQEASRDQTPSVDLALEKLFRICLARQPSHEELHWFRELAMQDYSFDEGLTLAAIAIFNSNEFIYVE